MFVQRSAGEHHAPLDVDRVVNLAFATMRQILRPEAYT
jgi:hypothetical protein